MRRISLQTLALYWHTVRHLRPVQVYGRLISQVARPRADLRPAPSLRKIPKKGAWILPARRTTSLHGPTLFCFLNDTRDLAQHGWDDPTLETLWRYNLHYFDDLNAHDAVARKAWHAVLLARWVGENPPPGSLPPDETLLKSATKSSNTSTPRTLASRSQAPRIGWEPYPTSLRIVNWIKWEFAGNALTPICVDSLASQTRWLMQNLEIHLLGNHLFANAKALVFAGLFFDGSEAQRWLEKGLQLLRREIPEQILSDGGHFERSTMYHALAFEDMLDLHNLFAIFAGTLPSNATKVACEVQKRIAAIRHFFETMLHPDGEISFFNDAAFGIAPHPAELLRYAKELGFSSAHKFSAPITHLAATGYLRIQYPTLKCVEETPRNHESAAPAMVALLDVAPLGPDYLPGHAHADTLSFELSLFGERVFVNSGTSCYGLGVERERQRGSKAHNTVVIDGKNSSEVWAGFRVARRAYPRRLEISDGQAISVRCAHDGYRRLPGHPEHERQWIFRTTSCNELAVEDRVSDARQDAEARFHLHPNVTLETNPDGNTGYIQLASGHVLFWHVDIGSLAVETTTYHPEFGLSIANRCLVLRLHNGCSRIRFTWSISSIHDFALHSAHHSHTR